MKCCIISVAFHQGLRHLLRQNRSSEKEILFFLVIITSEPSIYIMDHSDFTVSNIMGNSIGLERVVKAMVQGCMTLRLKTISSNAISSKGPFR